MNDVDAPMLAMQIGIAVIPAVVLVLVAVIKSRRRPS
jgi:hypothetical protein